MRLTVEPDEVEAAVVDYVAKQVGRPAKVSVTRFTRARTGKVYAEVLVEFASVKEGD